MKAVRVHAFGGPEVLCYEDAPRPRPGPGEVLVRVHAAGVNPVDWKVREGALRAFLPLRPPFIPGWDVSGVVEQAGPEVARLKVGDEVFSRPDLARDGAYAEFIVIREAEAALKPRSLDHVHAAAAPLAALTAWQALFEFMDLRPGQKVLIHGGAGGVGSFAVQLAKWKGAFVAATASARNQGFLRDLGADQAVDYGNVPFEDVVHGMDAVLDTVGRQTQRRSWAALKPGGILVSIVEPPSERDALLHGARRASFLVQPSAEQLGRIAELIDDGRLHPFVEGILPLEQARRAQEQSATGHSRGKLVLRVAPAPAGGREGRAHEALAA